MKLFLSLCILLNIFAFKTMTMNSTEGRQTLLECQHAFYLGAVELLQKEANEGNILCKQAYGFFLDLVCHNPPRPCPKEAQQLLVQRGICRWHHGRCEGHPLALEYGMATFPIDDFLKKVSPRESKHEI